MKIFVILLSGNHYAVEVTEEKANELADMIDRAFKEKSLWLWFKNADGSAARLLVPAIVGFYTRNSKENKTEILIEKQTELVTELTKEMKRQDPGDEWKES